MNRAYSIIEIKTIDNGRRRFSGIATTPEVDRVGDTINPMGASYKNPLPLLHHHNSEAPIGSVRLAKATEDGIAFQAEIASVDEPGPLKDRLDTAWGEIKAGLVRAVSIGFKPIKYAFIKDTGGIDFQETEIYELSTVSVPANASALITEIKSIDRDLRRAAGVPEPEPPKPNDVPPPAAPGHAKRWAPVRLNGPASGKSQLTITAREGKPMKISEKISRFENKRAANLARVQAIHEETDDSLDDAQLEEIKGLEAEVATIDRDLASLKPLEAALAKSAKPVVRVADTDDDSRPQPTPGVSVRGQPKLPPGIALARFTKAKAVARLDGENILTVATKMYGPDSDLVGMIRKANEVVPGTTVSGNWAYNLISQEGAMFADFAAFLRPQTILGKFGQGGIPNLRVVGFYMPLISQTGGGAGYWVGEGKPKPLTSFDFTRTTLTPLKVANIAVLTEENIRYSNPASDGVVRDSLSEALVEVMDIAFIDPTNAGTAGVKPASITHGAPAIASPGTDAESIRLGVRAVFEKFIEANNPPQNGVWILSQTNALAASLMLNPLGQREFPGITMNGGTFEGINVIASQHAGTNVVLVNASDVYEGDEGGIAVDLTREASLEMKSAGLAQDGTAGTGASLVSLWQNNLVGIRAERTINWKLRRPSAVAYLTGANWGGTVPAS